MAPGLLAGSPGSCCEYNSRRIRISRRDNDRDSVRSVSGGQLELSPLNLGKDLELYDGSRMTSRIFPRGGKPGASQGQDALPVVIRPFGFSQRAVNRLEQSMKGRELFPELCTLELL